MAFLILTSVLMWPPLRLLLQYPEQTLVSRGDRYLSVEELFILSVDRDDLSENDLQH
jgi:hypothetical protein